LPFLIGLHQLLCPVANVALGWVACVQQISCVLPKRDILPTTTWTEKATKNWLFCWSLLVALCSHKSCPWLSCLCATDFVGVFNQKGVICQLQPEQKKQPKTGFSVGLC
jgi:hypothetical protein